VLTTDDGRQFLAKTLDLLAFSLPRYEKEGKSYLTVGIGCTGGRHRSVAIAEALADGLRKQTGATIHVVHRDLDREAPKERESSKRP